MQRDVASVPASLRPYACEHHVNAAVPCLPHVPCPIRDATQIHCRRRCDATTGCVAFVHNHMNSCYLRGAIGAEFWAEPLYQTVLCRAVESSPDGAAAEGEVPADDDCKPLPPPVAILHDLRRPARRSVPASAAALRAKLFGGRDVYSSVDVTA